VRTAENIRKKASPPAEDVDAFIKASPKEAQAKLKQLRVIIKDTAPKADESIGYGMPAYKLNGKWLAGFAGYRKHIGFYGMTYLSSDEKKGLGDYETSKGTIRFPLDEPLPENLIKKILKARMRYNEKKMNKG